MYLNSWKLAETVQLDEMHTLAKSIRPLKVSQTSMNGLSGRNAHGSWIILMSLK